MACREENAGTNGLIALSKGGMSSNPLEFYDHSMKRPKNKPATLSIRRDDSPYDEKCKLTRYYYKLRPPFYSCSKIPRKSALSLQHASSSRLFFRPKGIRHLEILPSSKTSSVLDSEDVQVGEASVVKALIKH